MGQQTHLFKTTAKRHSGSAAPTLSTRRRRAIWAVFTVIVVCWNFGSQWTGGRASGASIAAIGPPASSEYYQYIPRGVSADGNFVVGSLWGNSRGFFWTPTTGVHSLDGFPQSAFAQAISDDGSTVLVTTRSPDRTYLLRKNEEPRLVLDRPGGSFYEQPTLGIGQALSADGTVVVGTGSSDYGLEAFRWTETDGMVALRAPSDSGLRYRYTNAFDVSADGEVVVGDASPGQYDLRTAFRWTSDGRFELLGRLTDSDDDTTAQAVSSDGRVVVGFSGSSLGGYEAFRWTEAEGMVGLGRLYDSTDLFGESYATAVSADGSVIVGYVTRGYQRQHTAFIWTLDGGMEYLSDYLIDRGLEDVKDWGFTAAYGISPDGRTLVGTGATSQGWSGWVARLNVPEPGLGAQCMSAAAIYVTHVRRVKRLRK